MRTAAVALWKLNPHTPGRNRTFLARLRGRKPARICRYVDWKRRGRGEFGLEFRLPHLSDMPVVRARAFNFTSPHAPVPLPSPERRIILSSVDGGLFDRRRANALDSPIPKP